MPSPHDAGHSRHVADEVRETCAWVAERARAVRVDGTAIPRPRCRCTAY